MISAAIYARKSNEQHGVGDDAKSVTRQVAHARGYAERKGWSVNDAHIYVDDVVSGAEFERRPGLMRLLAALSPRPPFQVLVMMDDDRFGREQIQTAFHFKQLSQAGVAIWLYLKDRELTLTSSTDKLLLSVAAYAAEVEREKARQRTYDAMVQRARAGYVTGGRVYGYDNVEERGPDGKRLHVRRVANESEAAVIRRIFELCAKGYGFRRIAHDLNDARLPAPRPSKGGPPGWSSSTVRDVLHRDLYRGVIVWNRTMKRDAWGQKKPQRRAAEEVIRIEAPAMRIVGDELWQAAHARLSSSRDTYIRTNHGRLGGKPTNGIASKYLLAGMASCGECGGALTVRSRSHGRLRRFFYACLTNIQRGRAICPNDLVVPLKETEQIVLDTLETDVLRPEVVTAAIREAVARLEVLGGQRDAERERLRATLARLDVETVRLTEALATGGSLPAIVTAIKEREAQRTRVRQDLAALEDLDLVRGLDLHRVENNLRAKLAEWRGLLTRNIQAARQVLRGLVPERLTFTPKELDGERVYEFSGVAVLDRLLAGIVPKAGVAPTGRDRAWNFVIEEFVPLVA